MALRTIDSDEPLVFKGNDFCIVALGPRSDPAGERGARRSTFLSDPQGTKEHVAVGWDCFGLPLVFRTDLSFDDTESKETICRIVE